MRATETDIRQLRKHLRNWGVPKYSSYPLLLRALTHPSISNWVERKLNLSKRSLGPNTLELLGDRVVGLSVATTLHQLPEEEKSLLQWAGRPSALVSSLVGNRGMAIVAERMNVHDLLRWEKPPPPAVQRARLDPRGIDLTTGFASNVEINALAAAYEAIAAAIYLDSGFHAAQNFVQTTLLTSPLEVQQANSRVPEYEEILVQILADVVKNPISFVQSRHRPGRSAHVPIKSFEPVQCEILDLEPVHIENVAHSVFYAAVVLRPMEAVDTHIREEDILCMASHFSVETARIAALTQAIQVLKGERSCVTDSCKIAPVQKRLRMREMIYGKDSPEIEAGFEEGRDRWWLDGDYMHVARLLDAVGAPGVAESLAGDGMQIKAQMQRITRYREAGGFRGNGYSLVGKESGVDHWRSKRTGGYPWREKREIGQAVISVDSVAKCLDVGRVVEMESKLHNDYKHLATGIASAEEICEAITEKIDEIGDLEGDERHGRVKQYHTIGHHVAKLWSVQRSMQSVSQERNEIIVDMEARGSRSGHMETDMIGKGGLVEVRDLRVRKLYVALGMCVEKLGTSTALAWLSGGEVMLNESSSRRRTDENAAKIEEVQ